METLNLDELNIKLSDYPGVEIHKDRFLEHKQQVKDITDKLTKGKLEIPDQFRLLEEKGIRISEYAQNVRQTAENNGFRVLDAQVSKYFLEQKREFLPPKVITCVSGTLDDIAHAGIKTAAELVKQRVSYDKVFPDVDIDVLDNYFYIQINYKKNKGRLTKLLTESNENWLRDFQKQLQDLFNIHIDLNTYLYDEYNDDNIVKKRKRIQDELKNPIQHFFELIYTHLVGNTATHARFMQFRLEQNKRNPNIYVADLRQFLFARAELKDSKHFSSYVTFVPK